MRQTAALTLHAALVGALLTVERAGREPLQVGHGEDAVLHLEPGDTFTVTVASDERWVAAQQDAAARAAQRDADREAAARQTADDSTKPRTGMTLEEGLQEAARRPVVQPRTPTDAPPTTGTPIDTTASESASPGTVTSDTGATRTRSTRNTG